jgi:hypothetical protein
MIIKKADKKLVKKPVTTIKEVFELPDEPNVPSNELQDYSILLYGAKKIGKTSITAHFEDAFFMSTEPGTKALRVYKVDIRTWKQFLGYVKVLEEQEGRFKTVIVDTIDLAYEYCFNHICKSKGVAHPSEMDDYGATWREIAQEFDGAVRRLLSMNRGVVFISHDTEKEIEKRDGSKLDRVQPTMARAAMAVVEAVVDIIANYYYDGTDRYLRIEGEEDVVSGCRLEEHFIRKGGEPRVGEDKIKVISMGKSAVESHTNFIKAFNNEQVEVDASVKTPPPKKKTFLIVKKAKG